MKKPIKTIIAAMIAACLTASHLNAATVSFLGSFNSSQPGPVLVSLPRNFVLTLNYTPNPGGGTPASGTMTFLATPNAATSNLNSHPAVTVNTSGNFSLGNNSGPGGTDVFTFAGSIAATQLGPNNVNYSFSFTKPADTISSGAFTPENIAPLVGGQSTIAFIGGAGGPNGVGTIRGAPEPNTMIALTGLVACGCGIAYRRRRNALRELSTDTDTDSHPL